MSLSPLTSLSNYIKALGQAYVYVGSALATNGLVALGATEGEIQVEESFDNNDLTAPEWTGKTVHQRQILGQTLKITVPLIMGDPAIYTKITPLATKGGGRSKPNSVVTTTCVIMPFSDIPSTLSYNGTTWAPGAPAQAVWLWRAVPTPAKYGFGHAAGGKIVRHITFEGLFDDTKPEGQKLYTIGDPVAQGVTGILI